MGIVPSIKKGGAVHNMQTSRKQSTHWRRRLVIGALILLTRIGLAEPPSELGSELGNRIARKARSSEESERLSALTELFTSQRVYGSEIPDLVRLISDSSNAVRQEAAHTVGELAPVLSVESARLLAALYQEELRSVDRGDLDHESYPAVLWYCTARRGLHQLYYYHPILGIRAFEDFERNEYRTCALMMAHRREQSSDQRWLYQQIIQDICTVKGIAALLEDMPGLLQSEDVETAAETVCLLYASPMLKPKGEAHALGASWIAQHKDLLQKVRARLSTAKPGSNAITAALKHLGAE